LFELSSLDGTNGFILSGGFVSNCVAGLGDLNHDGIDDFAVCSIPTINVIFGRPNIGASGVLSFPFGEPNGLNGANGFTIEGPSIISTSLSRAGDFNADGIDDFIVGDRFADPYGIDRAGRAYVVFGHPTPLPADVDGERRIDLDGDGSVDVFDFAILAASFGASVPPETAGDIDADGVVTVFDFALFAAGFGCSP
jgi:hypothetical protein